MADDAELHRWVATWRLAGARMDRLRRDDLAALTDEAARGAAEDMAALAALLPAKAGDTGLVEQQRRFRSLAR